MHHISIRPGDGADGKDPAESSMKRAFDASAIMMTTMAALLGGLPLHGTARGQN